MSIKRVLAAQDICSHGRCSLTSSISIFSVMGIQTCPLPVAWYNVNMDYVRESMSSNISDAQSFMESWERIKFKYDAIYCGFMGNSQSLAIASEAVQRFHKEDTLVFVDPAMSYNGRPISTYTPSMLESMRTLIRQADVITPTLQEAYAILGIPPMKVFPPAKEILSLFDRLMAMGSKLVVITDIPDHAGPYKIVSYDGTTSSYERYNTAFREIRCHGKSDVFGSVLLSFLMKGHYLHTAVSKAVLFLNGVVSHTREKGTDFRNGIELESCLSRLLSV